MECIWSKYPGVFQEITRRAKIVDVTLATDDGQHIQAHKIILSDGSNFFSDIFMKSDHTNMLIYLKGISSVKLEHLTDFLYNGEAAIHCSGRTEEVSWDRSRVKGLQGELQGISKTEPEEQMSSSKDNDYDEEESENSVNIIDQESILDSFENLDSSFDAKNGTMVDKSLALHTNN